MGKFKAALDSGAGKARIQADMALAKQVGANGTPNFYINGRNLVGAQPFEKFKEIIDDELARADKLIAKGTPPGAGLRRVHEGGEGLARPPRRRSRSSRRRARAPAPRSTRSPSATRRPRAPSSPRSPSSSSPSSSARSAAASTPRSSSWSRTTATTSQVSFRHNPLPFHNNAMLAALAAEAAREQGKFWEMHDKLFANQQALDRPEPREATRRRSASTWASSRPRSTRRRARSASSATWTTRPSSARAARPTSSSTGVTSAARSRWRRSRRVIDEEIKKADAKLAAGTPRGKLYAALTQDGLDKARARRRPRPDSRTTRPASAPTSRARRSRAPRTRW